MPENSRNMTNSAVLQVSLRITSHSGPSKTVKTIRLGYAISGISEIQARVTHTF